MEYLFLLVFVVAVVFIVWYLTHILNELKNITSHFSLSTDSLGKSKKKTETITPSKEQIEKE
jgi:hypothetical protein